MYAESPRRSDIIGVLDATGAGFSVGAVSVTDSATKIPTTNMANRKAISIRNWSNTDKIYIGGSGVTTADGFPILQYESLPFEISDGGDIYAITETGKTVEVRYIQINNN